MMKKIMIAGTKSGVGKTTITMGLLAALSKDMKVAPFKVGPDYIDPAYHTYITNNNCSNLDSYILDRQMISYFFNKNSKGNDIAVVEGVMGLFDGAEVGSDTATSASIAKQLNIPVILVVDGSKVASSLAATVKGFADFDKDLSIDGVIINNVGSEAHYKLLKEAIEYHTDLKACGYLIKNSEITMPERHLGLVPVGELASFDKIFDNLANHILKTMDIEAILEIAGEFETEEIDLKDYSIENSYEFLEGNKNSVVRIAVAQDEAFNFYYKDSLDLLEDYYNVEWVKYSPLHDSRLPDNIDGLYIGGGFPEVFAKQIEDNLLMKEDLHKQLSKGLPYIAECGGLMYLGEELVDLDGVKYNMISWLKGRTIMTQRLQRFGYARLKLQDKCLLGDKGESIKIHEFHRSKAEMIEAKTYRLDKIRRNEIIKTWECGYSKANGIAAYAHFHFGSNLKFGMNFVDQCRKYQKRVKDGVY